MSLLLAVALAVLPGVATAQSGSVPSTLAAPMVPRPATPATPDELTDYAQREAASRDLAAFEGGDTVVVISTGAALLLLGIILLIVLL